MNDNVSRKPTLAEKLLGCHTERIENFDHWVAAIKEHATSLRYELDFTLQERNELREKNETLQEQLADKEKVLWEIAENLLMLSANPDYSVHLAAELHKKVMELLPRTPKKV